MNNSNLKLLRLPAVTERTGLCRSTIYQRVAVGTFPKPVRISSKSVAWIESEVTDWIETTIAMSRGNVR